MTPSKATILDWRDQQKTKTSVEIKQYLESQVPLVDGKTIEQCALQAKEAEGFRNCIKALYIDLLQLPTDSEESPFIDTSKH